MCHVITQLNETVSDVVDVAVMVYTLFAPTVAGPVKVTPPENDAEFVDGI
jgi:hypothetical protein